MSTILPQAQALVSGLQTLMPSIHQQDSLQALLGLFLEGQGSCLPEHCKTKSASALSRFLKEYKWSTRQVIRAVRQAAIQQILSQPRLGRRPTLQVILDLTTLERAGKFEEFKDLIRVYNGKRGLHIIMLYLVVGGWRVHNCVSGLSWQRYSLSNSTRTTSAATTAKNSDWPLRGFSSG